MTLRSLLHNGFRTGVAIKGLDGVLEAVGGALVWFINPSQMNRAVRFLFQHELSQDPHDFVANHLLHASQLLEHSGRLFASIYLLAHGVVKILLAVALWMNDLWAYPLAVFVFGVFGVYQIYRYSHTHSIALLILTVFDAAIVWLTWREYRVQSAGRGAANQL